VQAKLVINSDNLEVMMAGFTLASHFIVCLKEACSKFRTQIFSFLLTLLSIPKIDASEKMTIENYIQLLGEFSGFKNLSELYAVEIASILREFHETKSYIQWTTYSKDRFKFDIIVRNCGKGLSDVLDMIIEILEGMTGANSELEVK
jgi:hypothetical protein